MSIRTATAVVEGKADLWATSVLHPRVPEPAVDSRSRRSLNPCSGVDLEREHRPAGCYAIKSSAKVLDPCISPLVHIVPAPVTTWKAELVLRGVVLVECGEELIRPWEW